MMKIRSLLVLILIALTFVSCSKDDEYVVEDEDYLKEEIVITQYADNGIKHQSAAIYGDYAFFVTDRRSALYCYNIKNKNLVCTKGFNPVDERTINGGILYHCNQMTFGPDFYDENDPFPLLYISQRAREDGRCILEVYRLLPQWNDSLSEYDSLEVELVQMIYFPVSSDANAMGIVNVVMDISKKLMYTYSYRSAKFAELNQDGRQCVISSFLIPDKRDKDVFLEDKDILDSFSADYDAKYSQGGCIKDGYLFITQGSASVGIFLNIFNLKKKKLLRRIDLLTLEITWEPEGCFVYNNNLMISTGENIYEFHFE